MRTYETCIILTVQSDKFIDAQARALFNYYVEMTGPHVFDYGLNFGKVFYTSLHPRHRKPVHTEYPRRGRDRFILCGFVGPGASTVKDYNSVREANLNKFSDKSFDEIDKWVEAREKGPQGARQTKKDSAFKWLDEQKEKGGEVSPKALCAAHPEIGYGTAKVYIHEWKAGQ